MDSSNLIKVVAAFVAGIVIALGGTLIYVRTNEMVHPQLVARTSSAVRDISESQNSNAVTGQDASDQATQIPAVQPDDQIPVLKPVPKYRPKKRATVTNSDFEKKPTSPTQMAQNAAPAPALIEASPQSPEQPAVAPEPQASTPPQPESPSTPATPQASPAPQPRTVTLPTGTNVVVRFAGNSITRTQLHGRYLQGDS